MRVEDKQSLVEELILQDYEQMYRTAFTFVCNENDAMDIVQESVYKAIKNSHKIEAEAYIRTWVWRIIINTACDFLRKQKKEVTGAEYLETGAEDTYQDFDTIEALQVLEPKEKTVIILRFFDDKKLSEISEIMEENLSSVKSLLYRGLKKLKIELTGGITKYE